MLRCGLFSTIFVGEYVGSKQLNMIPTSTYIRKRRKAIVDGVSGSSEVGFSDSKPDFAEFRHVALQEVVNGVRKPDSRLRDGKKVKKEYGVRGGAPGVHKLESARKIEIFSGGVDVERETAKVAGDTAAVEGRCEALLKVMDDMASALDPLSFNSSVAFVYNPLHYARKPHEEYVRKYVSYLNHRGQGSRVLACGYEPRSFWNGSGVPFGDSVLVREFLHISSEVDPPEIMHPKRPIIGLNCPRREVSGQRLWGWAQARFGTASAFLDQFWIHNYCPLLFMESSGKNRTPDKLSKAERASIADVCNVALRAVIDMTKPRLIVGIGKYAGERIKQCAPPGIQVGDILHPSPANPKANKDWDKQIEAQLRALGVDI
ncbi:uncharacterized protein [Physcomitrium patens]|uniref:uncharacterized protein isoform X1 n=1 Tax=Physcomitrium patens TaxID=3218 RepID=UPI003CCE1E55